MVGVGGIAVGDTKQKERSVDFFQVKFTFYCGRAVAVQRYIILRRPLRACCCDAWGREEID